MKQEQSNKPFSITKHSVYDAWKEVRENKGSAGIDAVSIKDYEQELGKNLYKLWNRMSSGTYFPQPVKLVEIPKASGGKRPLGIPTVNDRIAQRVVVWYIHERLDKEFHTDSYAYRSRRSATEAISTARRRCWKYDWVLDMDISKFFDTIDHDLLMRAVKCHVSEKQIHYPQIPFERYADDTICHCRTEEEAEKMKAVIMHRLSACKLKLNEEKTQTVYCKDSRRNKKQENVSFDFLGYTFRPRKAQNSKTGEYFTSFLPGISQKSKNHIHDTIRSWKLTRKKNFIEMDIQMSASVRGWMNYYGKFYPSSLKPTLQVLNHAIVRWAIRRYKRFKVSYKRAWHWLIRRYKENPKLFYHWCCGIIPSYFKLKPVKIRRAG